MKYNKKYKSKCFRRKYLKTSNSRGCGKFTPNSKKYIKGKGKDNESYIFIVYTIFNINWCWIVSIFRR